MTSRSLFFNLMKEDLRRRVWTIILAAIVFFFSMPVAATMLLQNDLNDSPVFETAIEEEKWMEEEGNIIGRYLGSGHNYFLVVVAVVGAIIVGISGYAFLHSKKQVDFYHSLPVKRETIFFVHFVDGILIYLIPYIVGLLLSLLICTLFGVVHGGMLLMSLKGLLLHFMGFLICYLFAILATLLTGKILINLFGIAVLFFYAPAIYALVVTYKQQFFTTMYRYAGWNNVLSATKWLSPVSWYAWLATGYESAEGISFQMALQFLIFAVILLAACLFLYKMRKSEKAGTAMAFAFSEPIIRILIAIPVGLVFGIILMMMQYQSSEPVAILWLCFGAVIGALLAHGIIESLYQFDVKKCLSHKLQLLGTVAVTVIIALSFVFDWFGFDSYLPEKSEIKTMAVNTAGLTNTQNYFDETGSWQNGLSTTIDNMELKDFDAAYEIAKLCSKYAAENRKADIFPGLWTSSSGYVTSFVIRYELNNGKEIYRSYRYDVYEILDLLAEVYRQEEYKEANYQILRLEELGAAPVSIFCRKAMTEMSLTLSGEEKEELIATYQKELRELKFSELITTPPVATLGVSLLWKNANNRQRELQVYIYPSMEKTLDFLSGHGFDVERIAAPEQVEKISVRYYRQMQEENDAEPAAEAIVILENGETYYSTEDMVKEGYYYEDDMLEITDPDEIAECMKYLVEDEYLDMVPFRMVNYIRDCIITFNIDEYGNQWTGHYYFSELPEFLEERLALFEAEPESR